MFAKNHKVEVALPYIFTFMKQKKLHFFLDWNTTLIVSGYLSIEQKV